MRHFWLLSVLFALVSFEAKASTTLACNLSPDGHKISLVATNTGLSVSCKATCPYKPWFPNGPGGDAYISVSVPAGVANAEVWFSIIPQYVTTLDPNKPWPIIYTCSAN